MSSGFEEYNEKKAEVLGAIDYTIKKAAESSLETLQKKRDQLDQNRFIVSVFGHFSNGKSTFLNALMGFDKEVLKEDDAPSTATITRLKYAGKDDEKCNTVIVEYRDKSTETIPIEKLDEYVARNKKIDVENKIAEVTLYVDSEFLKNGVEIVDTPGFNSTYKLHTEIALRQVESSDAAIFIFNCEKPGSGQEIDFLKKIKKYMKRVFFVMNKLDQSNSEGRDEIEDVLGKLRREGIDAADKIIYPISAKKARIALEEKNTADFDLSGMPVFEKALIAYLLSKENVSDRLIAPLESVRQLLADAEEKSEEQIEACTMDNKEIRAKIDKSKEELKRRDDALKSKKESIRKGVVEEVRHTKTQIGSKINNVYETQKSRLDNVNTLYDVSMLVIEEFELEVYASLSQSWETCADEFESRLMELLSNNVDDEKYYDSVSAKINQTIRSQLELEHITVDKPDFDFSALSKLDEDVEKAKKAYDRAVEKVTSLYAAKEEKEDLMSQINDIKTEYDKLRNKREKRIESLSAVNVEYGTELKVEDVWVKRNKIAQFFLGDKRVERTKSVRYVNDDAKRNADKEIKQIEDELRNSKTIRDEKIEELKTRAMEFSGVERRMDLAGEDENDARSELQNARTERQQKSLAMEKSIVTVEKRKYLSELKAQLDDANKKICGFLDNSRNNFTVILSSVLDDEVENIQKERDNLRKIVGISGKTAEEMQAERDRLVKSKTELHDCIEHIDELREKLEA